MGLIHIDLFATLDLVAQAPGGPEEDTEGRFKFGGWQAPFSDEVVGQQVAAAIARMDALLLGRKTYEIFAGYWPHQDDGVDSEIARKFNRIPKYVASRSKLNLEWAGSSQLASDVATSIGEIRARHENVHVIGSINFRADTALRTTLRSIEFVPVSNRSRLRQEGFWQRNSGVESDAC